MRHAALLLLLVLAACGEALGPPAIPPETTAAQLQAEVCESPTAAPTRRAAQFLALGGPQLGVPVGGLAFPDATGWPPFIPGETAQLFRLEAATGPAPGPQSGLRAYLVHPGGADRLEVFAVEQPDRRMLQGRVWIPGPRGLVLAAPAAIVLVACEPETGRLIALHATPVTVSGRGTNLALTALCVLVLYGAVGIAAGRGRGRPLLDPLALSQNRFGEGSLSRLQVLFFSLIVGALELYIVLRTGRLSDISETLMLLLGFAGGTAVLSHGIATGAMRPPTPPEVRPATVPTPAAATAPDDRRPLFADLVTTNGEVDVYKLQMLGFSLVVGFALLRTGFTDLATFALPENLLVLMGISQGVYLGGKVVTRTGDRELIRHAEAALETARAELVAALGAGGVTADQAEMLRRGLTAEGLEALRAALARPSAERAEGAQAVLARSFPTVDPASLGTLARQLASLYDDPAKAVAVERAVVAYRAALAETRSAWGQRKPG